jgi:hypothetical protein
MTNPIDPIRSAPPTRRSDRRSSDRARPKAEEPVNLPAVIVQAVEPEPDETDRAAAAAGYAAQLMGQEVSRRGLRGGPQTLENARSAYLGAEWSGPNDRRTRKGRITKTEI